MPKLEADGKALALSDVRRHIIKATGRKSSMGDWTFYCWSCGHQTPMQEAVRRKEHCPKCLSDMHACKNCRFFRPQASNQCAEPVAEYVPDKERSNFCGLYEAGLTERPQAADITDAKARLEALFRKD